MDLSQLSHGAVLDHIQGHFLARAFTCRQKVRRNFFAAGSLDDCPALQQTIRERFVDDHVHSLFERGNRYRRVGVIWRHHFHRRHILFLFQQLAEVHIGGAALELLLIALPGVVGLDELLADIAAAGHVVGAFSPGRILEQFPDLISDIMLAPLEVIDAILLYVAHRDDLDLGPGKYRADLADCLGAETDARQSNLLAGRDKSWPTEDVSRHNGECARGGATGQHELTA